MDAERTPVDPARFDAAGPTGSDAGPGGEADPGRDVESVWDYPRPPAVEPVAERIRVIFAGETVAGTSISPAAAWSYPRPTEAFRALTDHLCFYAGRVDEAWVGDERVEPQAGDFYGGWITSRIRGPFKGGPTTGSW